MQHVNTWKIAFRIPLIVLGLVFVALPLLAAELPSDSQRRPLELPHFPDRLHAVVWRNWGLIEPQRLAEVLGTAPENIAALAASMGLPAPAEIPPMRERGYITLIRRNWQLLPMEQLSQLLGVSSERLAFILREDDFLSIKLGERPVCERLEFTPPNAEARQRAGEIKQTVERYLAAQPVITAEPPFRFVDRFSEPTLPINDPTTALHSRADNLRFIHSYFALFGDPLIEPKLDPYPDALLARLHERGVNGVWMHVVLRTLAPGGANFPEWGEGHERRIANLKKLVARARHHGIEVYLYLNEPRAMPRAFFEKRPEMAGVWEGDYATLCSSDPRVRDWLTDSLAYVFREVPDLGGVFTITASENLTNCASHGGHRRCPRCKDRTDTDIIADIHRAILTGVHRSSPDAKVIAWDWGWRGHGDATDLIAQLPQGLWLMTVSEWGLPTERGGIKATVGEYAISAVGPGPRALRHWEVAREHGLKTVAKVQLNNSWELATVPYLPVMDLVAEHCSNLARQKVDGTMLSWSLGGYPSLNLELAQQFQQNPSAEVPNVLQALAEKHFGQQAAPHIRRAWSHFSRAFQQFPYHQAVLYLGPQQMGPANLLFATPTGRRATMVGFPYDDLNAWRGPYPAQVLADQFQKVADGWSQGITALEAAQAWIPEPLRANAAADLRVARAAQIHFTSSANQVRFITARDELLRTTEVTTQARLRRELSGILDREIDLAMQLYQLASSDSRLGYESSNHYFFVPRDLLEKVVSCEHLQREYQPAEKD